MSTLKIKTRIEHISDVEYKKKRLILAEQK